MPACRLLMGVASFMIGLILLAACRDQPPPDEPRLRAVTAAHAGTPTVTPLPTETPQPNGCSIDEITERLIAVPAYMPTEMVPIRLVGNRLMQGEAPFVIRGLNYYPAEYPLWQFLNVDRATLAWDMALMAEKHINTIRIFLWDDLLFTCPGSSAVPMTDQIKRLDAIIAAAASQRIYLIITLHEQPDPTSPPLYSSPDVTTIRTRYLVERYKDEPAILAWDLRHGGDADYLGGTIGGIEREHTFERTEVLEWLFRMSTTVRAIDNQHLITAGWSQDAGATFPAVDIVSFQHWDEPEALYARFRDLREHTSKPLLLIGVGYDSKRRNESQQSIQLRTALNIAEEAIDWGDLVGWIGWTAFDFAPGSACEPLACPGGAEDPRHYYGMWRPDRSPKPAANVIEVLARPRARE